MLIFLYMFCIGVRKTSVRWLRQAPVSSGTLSDYLLGLGDSRRLLSNHFRSCGNHIWVKKRGYLFCILLKRVIPSGYSPWSLSSFRHSTFSLQSIEPTTKSAPQVPCPIHVMNRSGQSPTRSLSCSPAFINDIIVSPPPMPLSTPSPSKPSPLWAFRSDALKKQGLQQKPFTGKTGSHGNRLPLRSVNKDLHSQDRAIKILRGKLAVIVQSPFSTPSRQCLYFRPLMLPCFKACSKWINESDM